VLPKEKHEFSEGWRAAQKGGPAGCTTGWASGLHIKAGWTVLFRSPSDLPSVFCAACQKFMFFIWKHDPPARPASN